MTRIRAVVVLLVVLAALVLGSPAAHAQTSDDPVPSPGGDAVPARRGYAYPIAWVLPLVFVLGAGAIGRALTRDLRTPD